MSPSDFLRFGFALRSAEPTNEDPSADRTADDVVRIRPTGGGAGDPRRDPAERDDDSHPAVVGDPTQLPPNWFDSPIAPLIWPTVPCLPRLADYQIW